jgi:hypothetical protein
MQDVSAAITAAVAPLVDRLTVQDATIARQAETIQHQADAIAELREDRGRLVERTSGLERELTTARQAFDADHERLAAEVEALKATQAKQDAILRPDQLRPAIGGTPVSLKARLRVLGPWLLAVLAIVALIALLAWPR